MTTRRSFLKKQLLLGGSVLFASGIDNAAKATKYLYAKGNPNALNLLCSSNVEHLNKYRHTINNFEMGSINLFAGNICNTQHFNDLTYDLSKVNYHAVNFSWQNQKLQSEEIIKLIEASSSNFVNCNYSFQNKQLQKTVSPYIIVYSGNIKIGITGVGAKTSHKEITYKNPITALNKIAKTLKQEQNCDKVICLADLGFAKDQELNNLVLAQASINVDVVVGAGENPSNHTAWSYKNIEKQEVLVSANKNEQRYTNLLQFDFKTNNQIFNTKNL